MNAKVAVLLKKKERLVQCEVNSNVHSAYLKLKGYIHLAISGPFHENSTWGEMWTVWAVSQNTDQSILKF